MFVVVKTVKCNKVFHGMEKASKYIKAYSGFQVSIHMDEQSAMDDYAVNMAASITPEKTNNDAKKPNQTTIKTLLLLLYILLKKTTIKW